jgi:O-antigen/teichoic acid export membrane protein
MGAGMLLGVIPTTARISLTELKHFNRDLALQIFRFGVPLAISMTLTGLISSVTRLLVETLDSREALGLYTVAFVLVQNSLTVLAAGISSTGYQLTVRAVEGGDVAGERRQLLNNGALLLSVLAPACVGMILTAQDIGANLVGAEFRDAVTTLTPWLAAASFFACLRAFFFDYSFQLGNRPNAQAWVTAIAAGIAIGLSVYLIPRDGPLGAAIAVAVSMFVSCCLAAVVGRRVYYLPFPVQSAFRVLLCCFVMGAFVFIMPGTGKMAFMCKVAVGVFVYTCAGVALNLLDLRIQLTAYIKGAARQGS